MTAKTILVIGSSNTDLIIKLDRIPRPGETVIGSRFVSAAGGKGANQAVAASRTGGKVAFVARVGSDDMGERAIAGFVRDGIDVRRVIRDRAQPSGVAFIFVGKDGENSIAVASGANDQLSPADVKKAGKLLREASILLLQLETPLKTVQAAVQLAASAGVKVLLNPAPARALPDKLLKHVYLLTPNETEAELLTGLGVRNPGAASKAADALLARGVENVIITMGARGAYVAGPGIRQLIPAYKVKAVDTTAGGDVFNGALAVALAEGKSLIEAAQFATAAAAISVTRLGAQTSAPTRQEILRFLRSQMGRIRQISAP
jgi:ribokinase